MIYTFFLTIAICKLAIASFKVHFWGDIFFRHTSKSKYIC